MKESKIRSFSQWSGSVNQPWDTLPDMRPSSAVCSSLHASSLPEAGEQNDHH